MGNGKKTRSGRPITYWHGGAAGLGPGDYLVPGTKLPGYRDVYRLMPEEVYKDYNPDWVYITTDRNLAIDFADLQSRFAIGNRNNPDSFMAHVDLPEGAVYKVEPMTPLEPDPDFAHVKGVSFRTKRARIVSIFQTKVLGEMENPTGAALRYQIWDDGTRTYDDEGMPQPTELQAHLGVTPEHLADLGRGATVDQINFRAMQVIPLIHPHLTEEEVKALDSQLQAKRLRSSS